MIGLGSDNEVEMVSKLLLIRFLLIFIPNVYLSGQDTAGHFNPGDGETLAHFFTVEQFAFLPAITFDISNIEFCFLNKFC